MHRVQQGAASGARASGDQRESRHPRHGGRIGVHGCRRAARHSSARHHEMTTGTMKAHLRWLSAETVQLTGQCLSLIGKMTCFIGFYIFPNESQNIGKTRICPKDMMNIATASAFNARRLRAFSLTCRQHDFIVVTLNTEHAPCHGLAHDSATATFLL